MVTFFKQQKIHNKAGKIQICQSESSGLLPKDDNEGDADNKDDNDDNDIDVDDEVAVDPVQGEDEHVVADLETEISPIKVKLAVLQFYDKGDGLFLFLTKKN